MKLNIYQRIGRVLAVCGLLIASSNSAWGSEFVRVSELLPIDDLDVFVGDEPDAFFNPGSWVRDVAFDDGTMVGRVGDNSGFTDGAFRYTPDAGMNFLSEPDASSLHGGFSEWPIDEFTRNSLGSIGYVSDDGAVLAAQGEIGFDVLGVAGTINGMARHRHGTAFRWTEQSGYERLAPDDGFQSTWVNDMSSDGDVIVGISSTYDPNVFESDLPNWLKPTQSVPFRWSVENGFQELSLPEGFRLSPRGTGAVAVSGDGTHLFGWMRGESDETYGFRWNAAEGVTVIAAAYVPSDVSMTGEVSVGAMRDDNGFWLPARWTVDDEQALLSPLPQTVLYGEATSVSADGQLIFGYTQDELDPRYNEYGATAFIWDELNKFQGLHDVLSHQHGLADALESWSLETVYKVSDDSRQLFGVGVSPDRKRSLWIVQLDRPIDWILGDADLDGDVDFQDFLTFSSSFGMPGEWEQGDFDLNGQIDFSDFLLLSNNFGFDPRASPVEAVPEPSGICLLILAGLMSLRFRSPSR